MSAVPSPPSRIRIGRIDVDRALHEFIGKEAAPGSGVGGEAFWSGFEALVARLAPRNLELLARRDALQAQIDAWHRAHAGAAFETSAYREFLTTIGYLVEPGPPFTVSTTNVDAEIAHIAGPQLVVPVNNARYALNAANARWGSLYDAFYGTDLLPEDGDLARGPGYNPRRGAEVVRRCRELLDRYFPLAAGSHMDARAYRIEQGSLVVDAGPRPLPLQDPSALAGYQGTPEAPRLVLLERHGLHLEIHIDRSHAIGAQDAAGVCDLVLEAALSTIQDCEDSVAAVDASEKLTVYRHWLGLMQGTLEATVEKGGKAFLRRLAGDRHYRRPGGGELTLPGRSLLLVRNVGQHIYTDAVLLDGKPTPESFLDAAVTALIGMHDLRPDRPAGALRNSRTGSIYIVKPKMHGREEVAFAAGLFDAVEDLLGLPRYTLKMGLMDEERRTSVNLAECIRPVDRRIVFINTGFLDRTGDEIHTCMEAGPVPRKADLRSAGWLQTYERANVAVGLACGLPGHAQIGKGMWAMPDCMAQMLATKDAYPRAGANTAWVPSPTAATLHALHYLEVDVAAVQSALARDAGRDPRRELEAMLTPARLVGALSGAAIERELELNTQGILGYVVRWIEFGIGCSKVPDTEQVGLMEDRATLRISSQLLANWLHWKLCTPEDVRAAFERMAAVVDAQNAHDPRYRPMTADFGGSRAFQAALDLVFEGRREPNGYTEAILTRHRRAEITAWGPAARQSPVA